MKLKDCFIVDEHKYNPILKSCLKKFYNLYFFQRYSMLVYLQLTECFHSIMKNNSILNNLIKNIILNFRNKTIQELIT